MNEDLRMALISAGCSRERMALLDSYREALFDDSLEDAFQGTEYDTGVCTDMPECGGCRC